MKYINKQFLSDDYDESGSMVLRCKSPRKCKDPTEDILHPGNTYVEASIQVRDCFKEPVDLCFDFDSEKGLTKRLIKVDNMIAMLEEFKVKLLDCWIDVDNDAKEENKNDGAS